MTKLTYEYGSPENNVTVRLARAKLPSRIGNHIEDKKGRAKYREGYAAAEAFGIEADWTEAGLRVFVPRSPIELTVLAEMLAYLNDPNREHVVDPDGMVEFFGRKYEHFGAGLIDARKNQDSDVIGDLIENNLSRGLTPPAPSDSGEHNWQNDPCVLSWKEQLAERPTKDLLSVVQGDPSAVDASHWNACLCLLHERAAEGSDGFRYLMDEDGEIWSTRGSRA
jgi:hypothetical protein